MIIDRQLLVEAYVTRFQKRGGDVSVVFDEYYVNSISRQAVLTLFNVVSVTQDLEPVVRPTMLSRRGKLVEMTLSDASLRLVLSWLDDGGFGIGELTYEFGFAKAEWSLGNLG